MVAQKTIIEGDNDAKTRTGKLIFKNNVPFISWISKISNTFIDSSEGLDIVMPLYNLLEHSGSFSITSRRLWNYYRDEVNDDENKNYNANNRINNNKTIASKSFEYKTKLIGSTPDNNNNTLNAEVVVPLKYLSNFWKCLHLPLINYEIELDLLWSKECIISET